MLAAAQHVPGWAYVSLALLVPGVAGAAPALEPERVVWTELRLVASKLLLTARSQVTLALVPSAAVEADLIAVEDPSLRLPRGPRIAHLTLETRFRKRRSTIESWLDPRDGQALQVRKLETGRKHDQRIDRFAAVAVHRRRRGPATPQEASAGPDGWSNRVEERNALASLDGDAAVVTEPSALFYLVSAAPLRAAGDRFESLVYSRRQLFRMRLEVLGSQRLEVAYDERRGGEATRREGEIDVLCIVVRARPLEGRDSDSDSDDSDFRFLGLRGDVEIFLEPDRRVPVQVSGRTGVIGRLDVRLERVELAP